MPSPKLTKSFYKSTVKSAIHLAGPRYTPGCDPNAPNLPINDLLFSFDILARTPKFKSAIVELRDEFIKETQWAYVSKRILEAGVSDSSNDIASITEQHQELIDRLATVVKQAEQPFAHIEFTAITHLTEQIQTELSRIDSECYAKREEAKPVDQKQKEFFDSLISDLRLFDRTIRKVADLVSRLDIELANKPFCVLLGNAGTGKTHFLCDLAEHRINNNLPTILLLGQQLSESISPIDQILKNLKLELSFESLLDVLNRQAKESKARALIIIDAINEGDKNAWFTHYDAIIKTMGAFDGVGLVVSCRNPFEHVTLPKMPIPNTTVLHHNGFAEMELDAVASFFKYYKLPTPEAPILSPEFTNPLFLKIFCKTLQSAIIKKKHSQIKDISSGQKGMTNIWEDFVIACGEKVEKDLKLPNRYCWTDVVKPLSEAMSNNDREWISKDCAVKLLDHPNACEIIHRMIAEGLLNESLEWIPEIQTPIEGIRFPYQKFSDHLIARYLLKKYASDLAADPKACLAAPERLGKYFSRQRRFQNVGVAEALIIEFPVRDKGHREILDFLETDNIDYELLKTFMDGLIWRDNNSYNKSTNKWLNNALHFNKYLRAFAFDVLIGLATKPKHAYNAARLNKYLMQFSVIDRDLCWTEALREQQSQGSAYRLIIWLEITQGRYLSREHAHSCLIILMWILTSTRHELRDRATRAIYYIGRKFPSLLFGQALLSLEINDPYVQERMLAAAYGVSMALAQSRKFAENLLAKYARQLFLKIFLPNAPHGTTHILARDYAQNTLQLALVKNARLLNQQDRQHIHSPFMHGGIRKWGTDSDRDEKSYRDGNSPFGFDFNNYTVGRLVPGRENYDFKNPEYIKVKSNMLWRIYELGYTLDKFKEIDQTIAHHKNYARIDDSGTRVDRYGKKYCWIAWHELAGFRQDKGLLKAPWGNDEKERFEVDIDPSFPRKSVSLELIRNDLLGDRSIPVDQWITSGKIPDLKPYLTLTRIAKKKGPWVLLDGYASQTDHTYKRGMFAFPRGLFVNNSDLEAVVSSLNKRNICGRWVPEIPEYRTTFSGEVSWSDIYSDRNSVTLSFDSDDVPHSPQEDFIGQLLDGKITINQLKKTQKAILSKRHDFQVYIPVSRLSYDYDSVTSPRTDAIMISKQICDRLFLHFNQETGEFYDLNNAQATLHIDDCGAELIRQRLIYIRQDLLEQFLNKTRMSLIWAIWGERKYEAKHNEGLDEFVKRHKAYMEFQEIIKYK